MLESRYLTLVERWRKQAELMEEYADERGAAILRVIADQLQAVLQEAGDQLLNLQEAAAVSGYTPGYLGKRVAAGDIPNAGRHNAPRIRRADLPIKPGHLPVVRVDPYACDVMQIVRDAAARN